MAESNAWMPTAEQPPLIGRDGVPTMFGTGASLFSPGLQMMNRSFVMLIRSHLIFLPTGTVCIVSQIASLTAAGNPYHHVAGGQQWSARFLNPGQLETLVDNVAIAVVEHLICLVACTRPCRTRAPNRRHLSFILATCMFSQSLPTIVCLVRGSRL
jgi:hypothetical protein